MLLKIPQVITSSRKKLQWLLSFPVRCEGGSSVQKGHQEHLTKYSCSVLKCCFDQLV